MVKLPAPGKNPDYVIALAAEKHMKPITQVGEEFGLSAQELLPYGHYVAKVDYQAVLKRLHRKEQGKYIDVTAITPTPLGEGKSTSTIGLVQGLSYLGKRASAAIRQPSGGPTMNIKGSAAGGGWAQCLPLTPFSLGLTGDINAIMNAHNLAMVALTARMQHEFNYDDAQLAQRKLKRLNLDPRRIQLGWVMDFCAQALRKIVIGLGDNRLNGFAMESRFDIAVSSEIMAILAVAGDLRDLRARMGRIIVGYERRSGRPVTTEDLEVAGAMTAWMVEAVKPNLMQTMEGQPVLVHAGPFANIAIGQSSIIADKLGLKLSDYHVTESGFGADIGFEKFWNLKCRFSGLKPHCAVIVATVRALKCHGGAPVPRPGRPLPPEYGKENLPWVEAGCANLLRHINTVKSSGVNPVVCINAFNGDSKAEIKLVRRLAEQAGARVALSRHWAQGGAGAEELAQAVVEACREKSDFKYLYDLNAPLSARIELIARQVYGAGGVEYSDQAGEKIKNIEQDDTLSQLAACMVKTHLSVTDNPDVKGAPTGWPLKIRDVLVFGGAGLIVPVAGNISLMPGTASDPAFRRIDVDTATGQVKGLF
jgi:formate--tetrahydrofolate ligase